MVRGRNPPERMRQGAGSSQYVVCRREITVSTASRASQRPANPRSCCCIGCARQGFRNSGKALVPLAAVSNFIVSSIDIAHIIISSASRSMIPIASPCCVFWFSICCCRRSTCCGGSNWCLPRE